MGWTSPESLLGLVVAAVVAVVAVRNLPRALLIYSVLGVIPWIQIGAFSGNEMVQGLLLAEVLATVLVGIWVLRRGRHAAAALMTAPFNRWLLLLLPAMGVSLLSGLAWLDPSIPGQNVKLMVSVGQMLLVVWPIGLYLVTADQATGMDWARRFRQIVMLLALPQFIVLAWDETQPYLGVSAYFGLIACPLACARLVLGRDALWLRVGLVALTIAPMLEGLRAGKAFLYLYVVLVVLAVLSIAARRLAIAGGLAVATLALLLVVLPPGNLFEPVQALVDVERRQQSWGGRAGRVALAEDAIGIWSRFPMFGVGPANSYPYMLRYSVIGTPHSQYFNFLLEFGLVGLALLVSFVVGGIAYGWRALKVPRPLEARIFLTGWLAGFVSWTLSSMTGDYMLHSIRNGGLEMFSGFYLHWVFLGAAVAVVRRSRMPAAAPAVQARQPVTWASLRAREAERLRA